MMDLHKQKILIFTFFIVIFGTILGLENVNGQKSYKEKREDMVENQIAGRGINDPKVLAAVRNVKRHLFVPQEYREYSYNDGPLPIGEGQTISQPYIVALMTEMLGLDEDDVVLEVGTGSGYQAAILAEICKQVYTIEIFESLGNAAEKRLKRLGYENIEVKIGDGFKGWSEHAPYDAIIVTAAPSEVPEALTEQLKKDGKMAIPVGDKTAQNLILLEYIDDKLEVTKKVPVRFVPMIDEEGNPY